MTFLIEFDINSVDHNGETLVQTKWIAQSVLRTGGLLPEPGEAVVVVDEWDTQYPAIMQSINERGFMNIMVKVDAPVVMPKGMNIPTSTPASVASRTDTHETAAAAGTIAAK